MRYCLWFMSTGRLPGWCCTYSITSVISLISSVLIWAKTLHSIQGQSSYRCRVFRPGSAASTLSECLPWDPTQVSFASKFLFFDFILRSGFTRVALPLIAYLACRLADRKSAISSELGSQNTNKPFSYRHSFAILYRESGGILDRLLLGIPEAKGDCLISG